MARTYTLKRRAEQQLETRQRIVEAAMALHGELGPARTPLSAVAERAGVQRNTLYAHFPDERSLLLACSAQSLERDPLPDPSPWRDIDDAQERLRAALTAIYAWYGRNAELAGCVLRDAETHEVVREIAGMRYGPVFAEYESVLGKGLGAGQRALLKLGGGGAPRRSLARESGLLPAAAVRTMVGAVLGATAAAKRR